MEFPHTRQFRDAIQSLVQEALLGPELLSPPVEPNRFSLRLLYCEQPTFNEQWNWSSWLLLHCSSTRRALVRRTTWRRNRAEEQIRGLTLFRHELVPQPLLEVRDSLTLDAPWESILDAGAELRFPALSPTSGITLDGCTYYLAMSKGDRRTKLVWRSECPGWQPLLRWVQMLRDRMEAAVCDVVPSVNAIPTKFHLNAFHSS